MDFSDIEKADKEAFGFLVANRAESDAVKDVRVSDASLLIDNLEQLHRYLSRLDTLLQTYSESIKGVDVSDLSVNLRDFSRRINLDIEFLKRKQ